MTCQARPPPSHSRKSTWHLTMNHPSALVPLASINSAVCCAGGLPRPRGRNSPEVTFCVRPFTHCVVPCVLPFSTHSPAPAPPCPPSTCSWLPLMPAPTPPSHHPLLSSGVDRQRPLRHLTQLMKIKTHPSNADRPGPAHPAGGSVCRLSFCHASTDT